MTPAALESVDATPLVRTNAELAHASDALGPEKSVDAAPAVEEVDVMKKECLPCQLLCPFFCL
jgi:hypothetical protein